MGYQSLDVDDDQKCCGKTPKIKLLRNARFRFALLSIFWSLLYLGVVALLIWSNIAFYCHRVGRDETRDPGICLELHLHEKNSRILSILAIFIDLAVIGSFFGFIYRRFKEPAKTKLEALCCIESTIDDQPSA